MDFLRRLLTRWRSGRDMPEMAAEQVAVTISLAAHGYQWEGRFVVDPDGRTTFTQGGDLQAESTVQLAEHLDLRSVLDWLHSHSYSPASRPDVGRVAQMTIVSHDRRYRFRFNRSRTVLHPNPVDALIDRCAEYGPILLDTE